MLRHLLLLAAYGRRAAARAWREADWSVMVVAAVFCVIGALVTAGAFMFFRAAFIPIAFDPVVGPLLVKYVLESAFAIVFFLGTVSFIASSIPLIYTSDETRLLTALPIEPETLFVHRFIAAALLSGWPVFVLGAPALVAFGFDMRASAPYYVFAMVILLFLSAAIAVVGGLLSLPVGWLAARMRGGWLRLAEGGVFLALLYALIGRIMPHSLFRFFQVSGLGEAQAINDRLNQIFAPFPTHPLAEAAATLARPENGAGAAWALFAFAVGLIAGAALLVWAAGRWYGAIRQRLEEGDSLLAGPQDVSAARPLAPFPRLMRTRHGYLFEKEWLMLSRDPDALSRGGFLFLLLFFYLLALRTITRFENFGELNMRATAITFAFAAIGYFALTLGLRFAYPSLSLEGRSAWALWSSPLHRHELFSQKFFFWSAVIGLPMAFAALFVAAIFGLTWPAALVLLVAVLCTVTALTAIAVGQGCLFPDFRRRDPDAISTSPSGLLAALIGFGYVWVMAKYVRRIIEGCLAGSGLDAVGLFGMLIVTLGVVACYWMAAPRLLEKMEVGRS